MKDRRVFLGWDGPALDAAVEWLLTHRAESLEDTLLALPGKRATRGLEERLARRQAPYVPLVSGADFTDRLLAFERPKADPLTRNLSWVHALQSLGMDLEALIPTPPAEGDWPAWLGLAKALRQLHGELAADGLDCQAVLDSGHLPTPRETERWQVLAQAQAQYFAQLEALSIADPHHERLRLARAGKVHAGQELILIGFLDLNGLQREVLASADCAITCLVFAPDSEKDSFDPWGCALPAAWAPGACTLPLQDSQWSVAGQPAEQAQKILDTMADLAVGVPPEDITIAVLDDEIRPYLDRLLHQEGLASHHAEGIQMSRTSPWRLLEALGNWLDTGQGRDLAALLRHPQLETALGSDCFPAAWDDYHNRHLPDRIEGALLGDSKNEVLTPALATLEDWIGARGGQCTETAPLAAWENSLVSFLTQVWGKQELHPEREADRVLLASFRILRKSMKAWGELPAPLAEQQQLTLPQAIQFLLSESSTESIAEETRECSIELVGWLELRLDPAPVRLVCGFNEGKVPEAKHADVFLPNTLRTALGMGDNAQRTARDAAALAALCAEDRPLHLVCGRQSTAGDPQFPSRLLFLTKPGVIAQRMLDFFAKLPQRQVKDSRSVAQEFCPPIHPLKEKVDSLAVTDFNTFTYSPYEFHLCRQLGLKTLDDRSEELDGASFGILLHKVLEQFGGNPNIRDEEDPEKIFSWLEKKLEHLGDEKFGSRPLPAVRLQLEQIRRRLRSFSQMQAQERADGWIIEETEWFTGKEGVLVELDGESIHLRAKVDRVDRKPATEEGTPDQWRILDYKTGDNPKSPYNLRSGDWHSLQLPLYRKVALAAKLCGEIPTLGLWHLGRSPQDCRLDLLPPGLDQAHDGEESPFVAAEKEAADIVRAIRAGVESDGGFGNYGPNLDAIRDPILGALAGQGLHQEEILVEEENGA